jgi:peptidoglycan-N-acetylglucosamine deacetylase
MVHALSFDIEDWFHVTGVPELEDETTWPHRSTLVERRTDELLEICADHGVRGTFFIVGWIAERHPALVRRIADAGHELGSHSHRHRLIFQMSPPDFREDLRHSIAAIEHVAGCRVAGFRAPCFSIVPGCEWAFDELIDAGVEFDASLFPVPRENGGYRCPDEPHVCRLAPSGRAIPELPMSLGWLGPIRTGFSGGSYFRLMPGPLLRRQFNQCERADRPAVIYLHPRDLAPDCPVVPMSPKRRLYLHAGQATAAAKLRMLLSRYRFAPCGEVLRAALPDAFPDDRL